MKIIFIICLFIMLVNIFAVNYYFIGKLKLLGEKIDSLNVLHSFSYGSVKIKGGAILVFAFLLASLIFLLDFGIFINVILALTAIIAEYISLKSIFISKNSGIFNKGFVACDFIVFFDDIQRDSIQIQGNVLTLCTTAKKQKVVVSLVDEDSCGKLLEYIKKSGMLK